MNFFRQLDCGNHFCQDICHDYKCTPCNLRPDVVTFCPCGKRKVDDLLHGEKRTSCLDPIPTCENVCDAFLPCAQYNGTSFLRISSHDFFVLSCFLLPVVQK